MACIIVEEMNINDVEFAHRRCLEEQQKGNWSWAQLGIRAARARDQKIMRVLEKAAEVIDKEEENQRGETRRSTDVYSHSIETTETQMWKAAYKTADAGTPEEALMWIYGAAACLAGFQR